MTQTTNIPITDFLAHYGVLGMSWGKRKAGSSAADTKSKKSSEHVEARQIMTKKPSQMSNAELKKLNNRLQLEQTYSELMAKQGTSIGRGRERVKNTLNVAKTISDVYNTVNSPAARAAYNALKSVTG